MLACRINMPIEEALVLRDQLKQLRQMLTSE